MEWLKIRKFGGINVDQVGSIDPTEVVETEAAGIRSRPANAGFLGLPFDDGMYRPTSEESIVLAEESLMDQLAPSTQS